MAEWTNSGISLPVSGISNYATAKYDNKMYIIGGRNESTGISRSNVYILDLSTNNWSNGQSMPIAVYDAKVCATSNGMIYLLGGRTQSVSGGAISFNYYVYQYNISSNNWTPLFIITRITGGMGLAEYNGFLYILGGQVQISSSYSSAIYYFPISNPSIYYTLSTEFPEITSELSSVIYEDKIYSVTGTKLYCLDLSDNLITELTGPAIVKDYPDTLLFYYEIWCISKYSKEVDVYNILTDEWRTETYIDNSYQPNSILENDDMMYVFPWDGSTTIYLYDMRSIVVYNAFPSSGFINEQEDNTFTWSITSLPTTRQKSATFQWRQNSTSSTNELISNNESTSILVPANTFPDGSFQWRVSVEGVNGVVSDFTSWITITTIDEKPEKPTNLNPNSGTKDGTKQILFSWRHNSPLSTPQNAYDTQITYDETNYVNFYSDTTSTQSFLSDANSIVPTDQTGKIGWRVRTYNSDNVYSEWSDTAWFIVESAPDPPDWVSVTTDTSFPFGKWNAYVQTSFQLQVLSTNESIVYYDTGKVFSADREHKLTTPLSDGYYIFSVRVSNQRGVFSDWSNFTVLISTEKKLVITLSGEEVENGVFLKWIVEG